LRIKKGGLLEIIEQAREKKIKVYVSSVTVLELYSGNITNFEAKTINEIFNSLTVVSLDEELAKYIGIKRKLYRNSVGFADLVIAGTAMWLGAKLATRNIKHFETIANLKFWK
jgi:predicted nucleic acid-binding protein